MNKFAEFYKNITSINNAVTALKFITALRG